MSVKDVLRDGFVEQGSVARDVARMLVFVAMRGDEVRAVGRAIHRDFALGAAADRANLFPLGGAEARSLAFFTDRTGHRHSSSGTRQSSRIRPYQPNRKRTGEASRYGEHKTGL